MLNVTINNTAVEVPEGTTILGAAKKAGVRNTAIFFGGALRFGRRITPFLVGVPRN